MNDDKPLPCAFCGHEREAGGETYSDGFLRIRRYCCINRDCPTFPISNLLYAYDIHLKDWNKIQTAIMAMRRKDFEAGIESVYIVTYGDESVLKEKFSFKSYIREQK